MLSNWATYVLVAIAAILVVGLLLSSCAVATPVPGTSVDSGAVPIGVWNEPGGEVTCYVYRDKMACLHPQHGWSQ